MCVVIEEVGGHNREGVRVSEKWLGPSEFPPD